MSYVFYIQISRRKKIKTLTILYIWEYSACYKAKTETQTQGCYFKNSAPSPSGRKIEGENSWTVSFVWYYIKVGCGNFNWIFKRVNKSSKLNTQCSTNISLSHYQKFSLPDWSLARKYLALELINNPSGFSCAVEKKPRYSRFTIKESCFIFWWIDFN